MSLHFNAKHALAGELKPQKEPSMIAIVIGTALPWLLIAWLGWQIVRQNGRILLRLDAIEKALAPRTAEHRHGPEALAATRNPVASRNRVSEKHGKQADRSLARSRLNRKGLKAGAVAPDFTLPRLDGGELSLADLRGGRVLLVFSDPDCGPCDELAPRLQELHLKRPDLQVIVISRRDADATRGKAESLGLTYSIVMQKQWEISLKYGKFATPIGYVIDEQGVLVRDVAVGVEPIIALADEQASSPCDIEPSLNGKEVAWAT
jgi:peroxiredoxin